MIGPGLWKRDPLCFYLIIAWPKYYACKITLFALYFFTFSLLFVCFCGVGLFVFPSPFCIVLPCFSYAQSVSFIWKMSYRCPLPSLLPSLLKCIILTCSAEEFTILTISGLFLAVRTCSPPSLLADVTGELITGPSVPNLCFPAEGKERLSWRVH